MSSFKETAEIIRDTARDLVELVRRHPREGAPLAVGAFFLALGFCSESLFPSSLNDWLKTWHGLLFLQGVSYGVGAIFVIWGIGRTWRVIRPRQLPPIATNSSAIKGPSPFTPDDGELFRHLGRETELQRLRTLVLDDQVPLVVLMGASGAGKTSLLRAGLTQILRPPQGDPGRSEDAGAVCHYWEATPTKPEEGLLRAVQTTWGMEPVPQSLEELVKPAPGLTKTRHVIILDQFEQLRGRNHQKDAVFRLLRRIARDSRPPHRITWVVAFRRDFRADWSDFIIPEHDRGFHPPELTVRLFSRDQAKEIVAHLVEAAGLTIDERVLHNLVEASEVEGEIAPVDLGIGLLVLAESQGRLGGRPVTLDDYRFAGGAEGVLTQYIQHRLDAFAEIDRDLILKALLSLFDPDTLQRIPEGRTCTELATAICAPSNRLRGLLERLSQRDTRLLQVANEQQVVEDKAEPQYRLPHERLIPALRRLAGVMLAEVDRARLVLESAYRAWQPHKDSRHLLRGAELRCVESNVAQIPFGADSVAKQDFLRLSRRRRSKLQIAVAACMLLIGVGLWWGQRQWTQYQAQLWLADNGYPPDLYIWQHQLESLALDKPLNLDRLDWISSRRLTHLSLVSNGQSTRLDNLGSCQSLSSLALDLRGSEVADLTPLIRLKRLSELTLHLGSSKVVDLKPLGRLKRLSALTLNLSGSDVVDVTPLENQAGLSQLTLILTGSNVADLAPLRNLPGLSRLSIELLLRA